MSIYLDAYCSPEILKPISQTGYIPRVRDLVRKNTRFFLAVLAAALLLRAIFILYFPSVVNDSFIYGDIAKNWLHHGIYGVTSPEGITPTYIRLPGYPMFLALVWTVFGLEHYRAVLIIQVLIDLGTCFLCASIALRLLGERAAKIAFLLAALCPFFANYTAAALTETLEIFFAALALDSALRATSSGAFRHWIVCGSACAAAILLRPDGAMLPFSIALYIVWRAVFPNHTNTARARLLRAGIIMGVLSILPLVPWTIRNWRVFHRFQPLAPRYANEEGEFVPMGFNHWTKTWIADYTSVEEVYWAVPGNQIDVDKLPSRAFDTQQQREQTAKVISDYNAVLHITPTLDTHFEELAQERARAHPFRTYIGLPILRILDMWLRPRTEMLPSDTRWWEFDDDPKWSALAVAFGVISLFYAVSGLAGWLLSRPLATAGVLLLFLLLRSAFLGTLENPEPRYTLEMYPVLIVFAAAALARRQPKKAGI
jgi:4-amino-4-deoxy-L-arabinose transferase-like glycosyltransferase